jgi:hypothetical protein
VTFDEGGGGGKWAGLPAKRVRSGAAGGEEGNEAKNALNVAGEAVAGGGWTCGQTRGKDQGASVAVVCEGARDLVIWHRT